LLAVLAAGVLTLGVAACGESAGTDTTAGGDTSGGGGLSGEIAGAGSSAQEAAQEAWTAGFQETNPDVTISYDPVGSGGGREQFISGGVAFAGSDSALADEELKGAEDRCGDTDLVQIPDYISPIAVVYNLPGVDGLQLSPDTIAGIFDQKITTWDDPAIAADNPDAELPSTRITPVNRSDESGTTQNFTDYLAQAAPDAWSYEASSVFPVKGGESAEGTSGVIEAVTAGEGTVGYADASQAGDLGIASIKVGDEWVAPSADGAAKVVEISPEDKAVGGDEYVVAYALDRTSDEAGTYPLLLVSYLIGCTGYDDDATTDIVGGYFAFADSAEGQQAAADNAGSAPLSEATLKQVKPAIEAIGGGS
jgi:phosphate transport system substrate-binding protein